MRGKEGWVDVEKPGSSARSKIPPCSFLESTWREGGMEKTGTGSGDGQMCGRGENTQPVSGIPKILPCWAWLHTTKSHDPWSLASQSTLWELGALRGRHRRPETTDGVVVG